VSGTLSEVGQTSRSARVLQDPLRERIPERQADVDVGRAQRAPTGGPPHVLGYGRIANIRSISAGAM